VDKCLHHIEVSAKKMADVDLTNSQNLDIAFFRPIVNNVVQSHAVSEVWEMGEFVLRELLGERHEKDVKFIVSVVTSWTTSLKLSSRIDVTKLRSLNNSFSAILATLQKGLGRRKVR